MKIKPSDYNRRDLFKLFGGSALFLHPLLSSREGYAQSGIKKRLILMHSANGVIQNSFWPKGKPGSYSFDGTSLSPLSAYIKDLNVIKGLKNDWGPAIDAHVGGMMALFTGSLANKDEIDPESKWYSGEYISKGSSIDQIYASTIKNLTLKSLDVSVIPKADRWTKYFTFDAKGKKIRREGDPYTVYESLFAEITDCGGGVQFPSTPEMKLKRQSILDSVLEDLKSASRHTGLTGEEKIKLDEYMAGLREIEVRLSKGVVSDPEICANLAGFKGEKVPLNSNNFEKVANLMQDLMIVALQMDLTRVATIGYDVAGIATWSAKQAKFNGKSISTPHHELTHRNGGADWEGKCKAIDTFHASQFARLVSKMKAVKEGNSTLLDNSLALWASEMGDGQDHISYNAPFILAGKAGGAVKTGRYIVAPGTKENPTTHHGLLLDVLDGLGVKHSGVIGVSAKNPRRVLA